ncbi:MAG: hypothetical protein ABFC63_01015 [Thermoguttaceae bacterium]
MNPTNDTDDVRFDRLVDGELSETERRELLAGLDNESGGWRRCALAFLEAQCWRQVLGDMAQPRPEPKVNRPVVTRRPPWLSRVTTGTAMAASFLVALWLVSWASRQGPVGTLHAPGNNDIAHVSQPMNRAAEDATGRSQSSPSSPWQLVTLSTPDNQGRSIRLPAIEGNGVDRRWLQNLPPAIPDDVLGALARTGHQVQQRRQLVPISAQDGRRLVVPVDQVEVHYTGNPTY